MHHTFIYFRQYYEHLQSGPYTLGHQHNSQHKLVSGDRHVPDFRLKLTAKDSQPNIKK